MSDQLKMTAPLLRVVLDDGATWEVQTTNRDLVAWDRTRARQRPVWPKFDEAFFLWSTFLAWNASTREGQTRLPYADWEKAVVDVTAVTADEDDESARPTLPGPEPG